MIFNVFFIFDYFLNMYLSENKFFYILSTSSLLEYLSVIPSFLAGIGVVERSDIINLTRVFRFLAAAKLDKILARHSMEVTRHYFKLLNTIIRIWLVCASVLLVVEIESNYGILDWLYFMIVTMASVGFGDVTPKTSYGRVKQKTFYNQIKFNQYFINSLLLFCLFWLCWL